MLYPDIPQLPLVIPKMALKQSAIVELIRIESPSSFYVRPVNHMRDSLVYREPFKLTRMKKYKEGDYVLVPIEERTFGRCQILKEIPSYNCAKVFFVDEAITSYVDNSCICKVFSAQCHNPCQVMHVSLARCQSTANERCEWTIEQCDKFRDIIGSFEENRFEITATDYDMSTAHDRDVLMVDLFGLKRDDLETRVSIVDLLVACLSDVVSSVLPIDSPENRHVSADSEIIDEDFVIDAIRREIPEDWIHEIKKTKEEEDEEWNISTLAVEEYDLELLEHHGLLDGNGCILGYMESGTVVSPSDMFIRLIHCKEKWNKDGFEGVDPDRWLAQDYDELLGFSHNIDKFYRLIENQKQLSFDEISVELDKNSKIYAMCGSTNKKTTVEGEFRRVEILNARHETAEVRYLDYGGVFHVKIKQLFRMHVSHSTQPPFCLPIKIEGIREVLGGGESPEFMICLDEENMLYTKSKIAWSMDVCKAWDEMIPWDVPVVIGPKIEFDEVGKLVSNKIRPIGRPLSENLIDNLTVQFEGRVVFGESSVSSKSQSSTSSYDESF